MVQDIPLDYMHLVCIGVMRKLLKHWVERKTVRHLIPVIFSEEISRRLLLVRNCVPSEFSRLPRPLSELCRWKTTELRQFLLYTGPVVLHDVLPTALFKHFLCLHVAIKLLSSEPSCYQRNNQCVRLLNHFVNGPQKLYGKHFVSFNFHCLIYLPNDVLWFGHLDKFSSFPFENLQQLKIRIRRSNNPLCQLVKRLKESNNAELHLLQPEFDMLYPLQVVLKHKHQKGPTLPDDNIEDVNVSQFKVAHCASWKLSRTPPNNCFFYETVQFFLLIIF